MPLVVANPNEAIMHGHTQNSSDDATVDDERNEVINDLRMAPTADLLLTARDVVQQKVDKSKLFNSSTDPETRVPQFNMELITLGRVLGRGGFCVVREIEKVKRPKGSKDSQTIGSSGSLASLASSLSSTRINRHPSLFRRFGRPFQRNNGRNSLSVASASSQTDGDLDFGSDHNSSFNPQQQQSTVRIDMDAVQPELLMASTMGAGSSRYGRRRRQGYVVKRVSLDLKHSDKITFLKGTVDLAMEAKYLAALGSHKNIIKLVGVAQDGPFKEGYFIVLDKMKETLARRIKKWMDTDRNCKGITGVFTGSKRKVQELLVDRLKAARDIASGAGYLHQNNVIFRDLKPDNIGFDSNNVLKIFDFGLAKELLEEEKTTLKGGKDGADVSVYRMTGMTGAMRYMSPEVGLGEPYNLSADVYSWAMVVWYMLALEPPFGLYSERMIEERVFRQAYRPTIFDSWSDRVSGLLRQAWDHDLTSRPSFQRVCDVVSVELAQLEAARPHPADSSLGGISE